jgi:hypothetical protein
MLLLAVVLVGLSHGLQDGTGLDLGDEGYIWYGAVRTAEGDVPIRDFRSYDPGRYYWIAAWSHLLGPGILGLRTATLPLQIAGLLCGLLALSRVLTRWPALTLVAVCMTVWMRPAHKTFESSIAMIAVYVGVWLLENPSRARHLVAGIFVGLAAFMGRNLGLYSFLAFLSLIVFMRLRLNSRGTFRSLAVWVVGIAVGYAPMLFLLAFVPGFARSFVESLAFLHTRGGLNMSIPVPWPWLLDYGHLNGGLVKDFSLSMCLLFFPLFIGGGLILLSLRSRSRIAANPLLTACTFVALFYSHHAFSRADLVHPAQAIPPLLMGFVGMGGGLSIRSFARVALTTILIGLTLPAGIAGSMAFHRVRAPEGVFVRENLGDDAIWILSWQAALIDSTRRLVEEHVSPGEGILIAPQEPALYVILGLESPIRDPYPIWPHTERAQREMIEDLTRQSTQWALVSNEAINDQEGLRFRNAQPVLWAHLMDEFEVVPDAGLEPERVLLRRRNRTDLTSEARL